MNHVGGKPSRVVIEEMLEVVEKHRAGAIPSDDLTLLCLMLKA